MSGKIREARRIHSACVSQAPGLGWMGWARGKPLGSAEKDPCLEVGGPRLDSAGFLLGG